MSTRRIYVGIEEDLLTLPEAERQVREIALSAMRNAGIATPDIEAYAAPRVVIDDDEEATRSVRVTMRFSGDPEERGATIDSGDVVTKVMAALFAAGFDPHFDPSN